ncbi:hypothetical protein [Nocardia nova]|uniref:hypothetical protein n=1 Tax=Nocardia nova TaxID=37330 RepID=UPI0026B9D9D2
MAAAAAYARVSFAGHRGEVGLDGSEPFAVGEQVPRLGQGGVSWPVIEGAAADRWTWLLPAAYTQLRLVRELTVDLPYEVLERVFPRIANEVA